jgi:hypothetical protein
VILHEANLQRAKLQDANLQWANLQWADLRYTDLQLADLRYADLHEANLQGGSLQGANLQWADLLGANLQEADLRYADLQGASLQGASLQETDLQGTNLQGTDLSGATGLLDPASWLQANFEVVGGALIVYRAQKGEYQNPRGWVFEPGEYITEVCNPCRTDECGCGVAFATLDWVKSYYGDDTIWKCAIEFMDMSGIVVPYNTDGQARCSRLRLIEVVSFPNGFGQCANRYGSNGLTIP